MEYTFKVWIDGNYYDDNEEYDVKIDLTDSEVGTIKRLVDEYELVLTRGLMPILKKGPEELYKKFYNVIMPHVFLYFIRRDESFEPVPGDEDRTWHEEDFGYLMKTYGDNYSFEDYNSYYFNDSYIVRIPEDMMPSKMILSKGMSKDDILKYIRKWNSCREGLFNLIVANHGYPHDKEASLYEIIEKRLLKIAEETIMNTDERTLAENDFDPFADLDEWDESTELYEEFKKMS
jgi:hypothetical protein